MVPSKRQNLVVRLIPDSVVVLQNGLRKQTQMRLGISISSWGSL